MSTNGQFEEVYKGWIISSGIFFQDSGLYNVHVYVDAESKRNIEPAHITNSADAARQWIDEVDERAIEREPWEPVLERMSQPLELSSDYYYWELEDQVTHEVMQKNIPFTTASEASLAALEFQTEERDYESQLHLVVCRVYRGPFVGSASARTDTPVYETVIVAGVQHEVGVTQLQTNALKRLWPYRIVDYHSDGDLTVLSVGRLYVVTTEGGVFEEKDSGGLRGY